ncbi:hypothetical protein ABFA07_013408 [Porites harrisoni]
MEQIFSGFQSADKDRILEVLLNEGSNKTFVNEEKKSKENGNKESRRDPVPTSTVKGHDGGSLSVGQWVAVAYNEGFFIGKITAINMRVLDETVEEIDVNFLTKTTKGNYKWPKRKDTDIVSTTYIFFSTPTVNEDGKNFVVNNEDNISKHYESYKKAYMIN